jgi:hypothetical protein
MQVQQVRTTGSGNIFARGSVPGPHCTDKHKTETEEKILPTHPTKRNNFLRVAVFCSADSQRTAAVKWILNVGFKENEDVDIRLTAAGCLFLKYRMLKKHRGDVFYAHLSVHRESIFKNEHQKQSKRRVWVMPVLSKRKRNQTYTCLLYSSFKLLNPWPRQTAIRPNCAEVSLQLELATKQNTFVPYRPPPGVGSVARIASCSNILYMLQNCCRIVAKHRVSVSVLSV